MNREEKFVTPDVNLLPEDDLESKPGGRFLKWALSWGKRIIVLIELLVVFAFLSRFKLDSDVANYSEEIDRRKTIIVASKEFEKEFRQVQEKITVLKKIDSVPSVLTIYDSVQNLIPTGVVPSEIIVSGTKVTLKGDGEDQAVSQMVNAFRQSPNFDEVNVERVVKQGNEEALGFSMTAAYKEK